MCWQGLNSRRPRSCAVFSKSWLWGAVRPASRVPPGPPRRCPALLRLPRARPPLPCAPRAAAPVTIGSRLTKQKRTCVPSPGPVAVTRIHWGRVPLPFTNNHGRGNGVVRVGQGWVKCTLLGSTNSGLKPGRPNGSFRSALAHVAFLSFSFILLENDNHYVEKWTGDKFLILP